VIPREKGREKRIFSGGRGEREGDGREGERGGGPKKDHLPSQEREGEVTYQKRSEEERGGSVVCPEQERREEKGMARGSCRKNLFW